MGLATIGCRVSCLIVSLGRILVRIPLIETELLIELFVIELTVVNCKKSLNFFEWCRLSLIEISDMELTYDFEP
jgi:hypothetical protein